MTNFIGDIIMSREMIIGASNTLVVNHHWCVDVALNSIHISKDTGSKHCCVVGRLFETVACGICFEVCGRNVAAHFHWTTEVWSARCDLPSTKQRKDFTLLPKMVT